MGKIIRKWCTAIALIASAAFAPVAGQTISFENQLIEQIDISIATEDSDTPQDTGHILSRMKTREGDIFSQTDFDSDLKTLIQDYDHIDPDVESINGKIFITLIVWPKPVIRQIYWEGNERLKSSTLRGELGIANGALFDRVDFNKAFHKVKAYYVKKGFFEAQLEYQVDHNPETNEVEISVCIDEGRAGRIKELVFRGFSNSEEAELAEMMVTKKYNFFLSWLTGTGTYKEEMVQHDRFIVLNFLQNLGYADAKVDLDVEEAKEKNRIIIFLTATKGPQYTFGEVTFEGNTIFSDDTIASRIKINEGDPYSPEKIHDTVRSLMNYYGRYGYIESVINYEPKRVDDEYAYSVKFTIDEGDEYRIGLVKVFGNGCTQTKVILHESLLIPGDVFNIQKLQLTEIKLSNIGYFKNVNVYAVKSADSCPLPGKYRDVHIEVEETSTGNFGAFMGFSTAENIFGGVNITEKNFNIAGFRRIFCDGLCALRGGGEYAHITTTIGAKSTKYVLSWTKPYFMDTPWSVGFDIDHSHNEYISNEYEIRATGFTLHASYRCNPFVRVGCHYRVRYTDIHVTDDASHKLREESRNAGLLSAVGYSWCYDSTDHPLNPTCGFKSRVEGEFAGIGGSHTFVSAGYLNSWYYDLWGSAIFKVRGDVRFIQPLFNMGPDDLPIDERFFLGGDNQIRGYRPYRVGPKFGEKDEPRGGISMQLFSAEISRCLFSRAEGFVFFDAGHLSMKKWNFGKLYTSVGYGTRLSVFPGGPPLTIGMGYPLNPKDSTDVKKFFLMVGGRF